MRILIADDEKIVRNAMRGVMKPYGECSTVADGREALNAIVYAEKQEKPFGLIVLDISMERMSGIEVLKAIRKLEDDKDKPLEERAKVIMVTGNSEANIVKECIEAGCNKYIIKPLKPATVLKYVGELGITKKVIKKN